ncbi:DUF6327 family protein [Salegentibacter sp. HM20]
MKVYSSFEEVDRDLEILKLQTQIDREEMKLKMAQTKSALSPISIMGSMLGSIAEKAIILKAVSKIIGVKRVIVSSK